MKNTDYAIFPVAGVFLIFGVAYASLISLKPFLHRSRSVATAVVLFSCVIFSVWYLVRSLGLIASAANIAIAIFQGALVGGALGLALGFVSSLFVTRIIGKPLDSMPYCVDFEFSPNDTAAARALLRTLDRLEWKIGKSQKSRNPEVPLLATYQKTHNGQDYTLGLHFDADGTTFVKLVCYADAGKSVTSDAQCNEQLCAIRDLLRGEGLGLVKDPYIMSSLERALTYDKLWNFSLGYTDSKLEKWLEKHPSMLKKMLRYGTIALLFGIAIYVALPAVGLLIKPASSLLSDYSLAISVLSFVFSFFGLSFNLPERIKRISRKRAEIP